jgi:hypothetical protein
MIPASVADPHSALVSDRIQIQDFYDQKLEKVTAEIFLNHKLQFTYP